MFPHTYFPNSFFVGTYWPPLGIVFFQVVAILSVTKEGSMSVNPTGPQNVSGDNVLIVTSAGLLDVTSPGVQGVK